MERGQEINPNSSFTSKELFLNTNMANIQNPNNG
jgi:hypothetical protein